MTTLLKYSSMASCFLRLRDANFLYRDRELFMISFLNKYWGFGVPVQNNIRFSGGNAAVSEYLGRNVEAIAQRYLHDKDVFEPLISLK